MHNVDRVGILPNIIQHPDDLCAFLSTISLLLGRIYHYFKCSSIPSPEKRARFVPIKLGGPTGDKEFLTYLISDIYEHLNLKV